MAKMDKMFVVTHVHLFIKNENIVLHTIQREMAICLPCQLQKLILCIFSLLHKFKLYLEKHWIQIRTAGRKNGHKIMYYKNEYRGTMSIKE